MMSVIENLSPVETTAFQLAALNTPRLPTIHGLEREKRFPM